jgi:galactokinase/mevalonate kinase-like predicted kinase
VTADTAVGAAPARAALAGNPSDGYGGAVLAVTLSAYSARAQARLAARRSVQPSSAVIDATLDRFAREHAPRAATDDIRWSTTVPRGVGLGGSSAIVIAVLRALCALHKVTLEPPELAQLALAVEVEELGIAGGLQDRVAQAYGGLVFMDFAPASPRYEMLAPSLLPPLLLGWHGRWAGESGTVHAPLRDRFETGDQLVIEGMRQLAGLARGAREALVTGDAAAFARCVDGSFDQRQRMLALHPRHVDMVQSARAIGASVNYAGSGGAIIAVCRDDRHRDAVGRRLRGLGCDTTALRV